MQCNCDDNIDIQLGKVKESTKVCFESQGNFEVCLTKEFASLASSLNACIIRKIQDDVSVIICKVNSQQTTNVSTFLPHQLALTKRQPIGAHSHQ